MENYRWQQITARDSETGEWIHALDAPLEVLTEDGWVEGHWDASDDADGCENQGMKLWGMIHDPGGPLAGELDVEIWIER